MYFTKHNLKTKKNKKKRRKRYYSCIQITALWGRGLSVYSILRCVFPPWSMIVVVGVSGWVYEILQKQQHAQVHGKRKGINPVCCSVEAGLIYILRTEKNWWENEMWSHFTCTGFVYLCLGFMFKLLKDVTSFETRSYWHRIDTKTKRKMQVCKTRFFKPDVLLNFRNQILFYGETKREMRLRTYTFEV